MRTFVNTVRARVQTTTEPREGLRCPKNALKPPKRYNAAGRVSYDVPDVLSEINVVKTAISRFHEEAAELRATLEGLRGEYERGEEEEGEEGQQSEGWFREAKRVERGRGFRGLLGGGLEREYRDEVIGLCKGKGLQSQREGEQQSEGEEAQKDKRKRRNWLGKVEGEGRKVRKIKGMGEFVKGIKM